LAAPATVWRVDLPAYDDLPIRPDLPAGSSWGVWGDDDVLGCLNLLTPERVNAAASSVRDGAVFALNLELDLVSPPLFARAAFEHEVIWLGGERQVGHDELLHRWNPQSSSQWDGFRHIRHPVYGFYGGVEDEQHGVDHWARRGIVGRAVVCDLAGHRASIGRPIEPGSSDACTAEDVRGAIDSQGVAVETGDILLLHTGWVDWYRSLDEAGRTALATDGGLVSCGLASGEDTLRLLWDLHVAAVAADNPAVEAWPPGRHLAPDEVEATMSDPTRRHEVFMHFALLPLLGLPLGELWDLGPLTRACRADQRWTCLLVSAPLNLRHGVGTPANAIALR
jgi:hypothetical protein